MLKRLLPIILIFLLLAGCQLPTGGNTTTAATPTMSDNEMATKVAQILTTMPSPTPMATQAQVEQPKSTESAPEEPTVPPEPSSTPEPSNTPEAPAEGEEEEEEVEAEPTESTAATATLSPTLSGDPNDPASYLGKPAWEDTLDKGSNWIIDEDAYSIGKIDSGNLVMTGKQAVAAWRLAGTGSLTNVYLEAAMKMDKCSGKDAQGLMFRAPSLTLANSGYFFGITCDGNFYLNKFNGAVMTTLIDYTPSTAILKEANQVNRIGILMKDKSLTFFINGKGVIEKTDSTYTSGYFGIFVKPTATIPLTTRLDHIRYWTDLSGLPADWKPVQPASPTATSAAATPAATQSPTPAPTTEGETTPTEVASLLSDLLLTPVSTSQPGTTATPAATTEPSSEATVAPDDPAAKLGNADWVDLLNDGKNWIIDEDDYSISKIQNGYMVMTGKKNISAWRLAGTGSLTNAYVEAKFMTDASCKTTDSYGIFFRSPSLTNPKQGYLFGVTCDGRYFLWKWDGKVKPDGKMTTLIDYTASSAIVTGANQVNKLGVLLVSNQLQFYVNGVVLQQISDNTYPKGYIGIFVRPGTTSQFTVKLDEMKYWID